MMIRRYLATSTAVKSQLVDRLGLKAADLDAAFEHVPNLQQYNQECWERTYNFMADQGFAPQNFVKIVSAHPPLLASPVAKLHESLECWRTFQFGEYATITLLTSYPELFAVDNKKGINAIIAVLSAFLGTRKKAYKVLMNSPEIVRDKVAVVETKIGYLRDVMKVDAADVVHCNVFSLPLAKIRLRHETLVRLGVYRPKSAKADENEKSGNAKLSQIFDTSDKAFVKKVAFITLEEYEVFEQLLERELEAQAKRSGRPEVEEEMDDDDDSEEMSKV